MQLNKVESNMKGLEADVDSNPVVRFQQLYQSMNRETFSKDRIANVYDADIVFEDCFHHIQGLEALCEYFENLYENVNYIEFTFHKTWLDSDGAMLTWTMSYQHPKLNQGKTIHVSGASQLTFKEHKIIAHKDYFDGGSLLYEHIPVLKKIIQFLKKRLA